MTLLEEIQAAAVDANSDLGTLLRKCKLLAARLNAKPFEEWINWESNGYPADGKVPEYRIWSVTIKGHFAGWGGSGIQNATIPMVSIPKSVRAQYQKYRCRQSVASIEAIWGKSKSGRGTLQINTGDLALMLGEKVYRDMNCIQAWGEFAEGHLVEVLNAVRNRILDFTLAIQKEAPTAGEPGIVAKDTIQEERVTQIFNTTVYGGAANVIGTAKDSTLEFNIGVHDFQSLQQVLEQSGVEKSDLLELKQVLESEAIDASGKGFGPKVSKWIGKMTQKAADGTWKIGLATAGNLLARAIAKYYGIGE